MAGHEGPERRRLREEADEDRRERGARAREAVRGAMAGMGAGAQPPPGGGNVYVVHNPLYPENLYKIGTTRFAVDERMRQLEDTGVPMDANGISWVIDIKYTVPHWDDAGRLEEDMHQRLAAYRVNGRREFFYIEFDLIVDTLLRAIRERGHV